MKGRFTIELGKRARDWRAMLLQSMLRVMLILGVLVYIPSVYLAIVSGLVSITVIDTLALLTVIGLFYFDHLPFRARALSFCGTLYVLGLGLLLAVGSISQIYLLGFSVMTALLLGIRAGLLAALLSSATFLLIGFLGRAAPEMMMSAWRFDTLGLLVITLNFSLVNTLVTLATGAVISALDNALGREIEATVLLDHERKFLRTLIDTLPDVVFTKDCSGKYVNCNQAALGWIGLEREDQVVGKTVFDLFPKENAEVRQVDDGDVLAGRPLLNREEHRLDSQGNSQWFLTDKVPLRDAAGEIVGLIGIIRNITERKSLEEQLRQSHKMEAIGQLAGGVAHDFNNLLTIITGHSELLLSMPEVAGAMEMQIKAIREAGERAASLTAQLLAFSRRSLLRPQTVDLNAVVGKTGKMLRRLIGEDIHFATVLDPNLSPVRVDPGQLDQVLINLAVNARDSMPQGGNLTLETGNVELGDDYVETHPDCQAGRHVMLAMTDTGRGMTPEVKARIFEPFFTTKGLGKGTGLGLAMVFGIVRQSGGTIHVYSEVGRGSTFKIYFPAEKTGLVEKPGPSPVGQLTGNETILVVEDEEAVRQLVVTSLQGQGYHVLTARDGLDALKIAADYRGTIALLLTDVIMPNMSGPQLADRLLSRCAEVKVLFMSGYTGDAVGRHGLLPGEAPFILKPFTPSGLAKKVREVLGRRENLP